MATDRDYHNTSPAPATDAELIAALEAQQHRVKAAYTAYLLEVGRLQALVNLAAPARREAA